MRTILTALQEGRLLELPDAGKDRVLEFLARILDANPDIMVGTDAIEKIKEREQVCNTGIGMGIAIPHFRTQQQSGELYCAIGWSAAGIDYGAADNGKVHLVVMYYIPFAQKNVYLKEVSQLVKAMRKLGGIEPIAHAPDLNAVRNLLLDWVASVADDTSPEAVARMIRLEIKQSQGVAPAAAAALGERPVGVTALPFAVVAVPGRGALVLSSDPAWTALLEGDRQLAERLTDNAAFAVGGRHVFVLGNTPYADGRVLYQCVGIAAAR
jgi:mannitol/fructose-specific phosphotransferase system IIA component (Ntr-type)